MILEALNSVISGVCNVYPVIGDIESTTPFAVFGAYQTVLRDKSGICGYVNEVTINVVDPDLSVCVAKSSGICAAVDGLSGTTTQGTTFDIVHYVRESHRFDSPANNYINEINYKITTQNI